MSICLNHDFLPCSLLLFLSNILFRKPPNNNLKLSKITLSDDHFQIPPPSNTKLTHAGGGGGGGGGVGEWWGELWKGCGLRGGG